MIILCIQVNSFTKEVTYQFIIYLYLFLSIYIYVCSLDGVFIHYYTMNNYVQCFLFMIKLQYN